MNTTEPLKKTKLSGASSGIVILLLTEKFQNHGCKRKRSIQSSIMMSRSGMMSSRRSKNFVKSVFPSAVVAKIPTLKLCCLERMTASIWWRLKCRCIYIYSLSNARRSGQYNRYGSIHTQKCGNKNREIRGQRLALQFEEGHEALNWGFDTEQHRPLNCMKCISSQIFAWSHCTVLSAAVVTKLLTLPYPVDGMRPIARLRERVG